MSREAALRKIRIGDLFNAAETAGPVRICLTMAVTESAIQARAVTTQEIIEFDRRTGVAEHRFRSASYRYVIDSIAPLPTDIHDIMLSLDRRYRESEYRWAEDPDWKPTLEDTRLTKEQIRGLLFVSRFYEANPI